MNGGGRILLLAALAACGADQRSGAAPADTSRPPMSDTAATAGGSDSAARPVQDTGATTAPRESAVTQRDTAPSVAARPPRRKPPPKPAAPVDSPPVDTVYPEPSAPAVDTASTAASPDTASTATNADTTTLTSDTSGSAAEPASQAAAPMRDQYHPAPLDTVSQEVYDGWKQYNLNCARCHGEDVLGTTIAPHLLVSLKPGGPINTKELFMQVVCAGRPAKGMPAWCPLGMEMSTIEEIYAYVKGRSDGKLRPGRPARREEG